jgi:hypothetical protein
MMKILKHGLLVTALITQSAFTCTIDGEEGFLPENDLKIEVNAKRFGGISEAQFTQQIDKVIALYEPIVGNYGGTLQVERKWSDPTVNAYAQQSGKIWKISMFGGLARHETITEDGFALVVCHELGHHIGGAPLYSWKDAARAGWASTEGQSDYFSTAKCLRRVWQSEDNAAVVAGMEIPQAVKDACGKQWTWENDYNICLRGALAGDSVAKLFAALRKQPPGKFETPDTAVVKRTFEGHPAFQCRLDTYFQGALCEKTFTEDFTRDSEVAGSCHGTTGQSIGMRPVCWFKPLVQ